MRPTLRQMQYLVAIADTGKFGEAARRVGVSQPSLSAQIADMEATLGAVLIERGRMGAYLSPVGEEVLRRARFILRDVEDMKAIAGRREKTLTGRIRLGLLPTICAYLLPGSTKELHANYPDLRLSVREERTIDLEAHLHEGQLDAVVSTVEDHVQVNHEVLFREALWVCAASDDPLAKARGPIKLSALRDRELLTLGYGHRLNMTIQELAKASGAHVSTEYEGTSLDAIRQMAEMGAGVAVLPSLYAHTEAQRDPDLVVRRIDDAMATREIALIWRDSSPLADDLRQLAHVFKRTAEQILTRGDGASR